MEHTTRREFLTKAGLSVAGVAVGSKLPGALSKGTSAPMRRTARNGSSGAVSPMAAAGDLPSATLHLAIPSSPEADAHIALAPEFTKYTKGKIKVEVEQQSRTGYEAKFLTVMEARSSEWDIVRLQNTDFLLWGPAGYVVPFTKFMSNPQLFNAAVFKPNDYLPALIDNFKLKGELYGFIQEASGMMLYYRKDLLKKYGGVSAPPAEGWSLDEVYTISKKMQTGMKAAGLKTYPFYFAGAANQAWGNVYEFASMTNTNQLSSGLEPQYAQPKVEATLSWSTNLQKEGLVPPGIESDDFAQGVTVFQDQQVAMGLQWDAGAPTLLDKKQSPAIYDKMGFAAFPYDTPYGPDTLRLLPSIWALGISKYSNYQEAAFAYITWFCSPEIARQYVMTGGGSTGRQSILSEPAVLDSNPQYEVLKKCFGLYRPLPEIPAESYIAQTLMANAGTAIWSGTQSVDTALKNFDQQALSYMKEEGVSVS